ncbi:hypothetical protein LCGC14_1822740 [marine sediment metagenome]|uniref:HEPN domain-containing protein n=1 Tax=marine sediment metagenome TaxID=412755 RepID=A0A0F9IY54_9ZZZZ
MTYQDHLRTFFEDAGPIADAVVKCAIYLLAAREAGSEGSPEPSVKLLNKARAYAALAVALEKEA